VAIAPGTRFDPYEVGSARTALGLGEVYDARDTDQQRDVAFRVLRVDFAADPARLRRFEEEAHAAAKLAHPNILTVHDVGTDPEAAYVVSEPIDGATLREALEVGGLPVSVVTHNAAQVARGLAAAHGKGIVHGDLKPENILVASDGGVKIIGFGLAAVTQNASELVRGAPLGTLNYMSPEQLRGTAADERSDMFAFGTIVYEMLTGARAFSRDVPIETMTAVLESDPPLLVPDIPPALARSVALSLKKDPASRLSAEDVVTALREIESQRDEPGAISALATSNAARPATSHAVGHDARHAVGHDARDDVRHDASHDARHDARDDARHDASRSDSRDGRRFVRVAVMLAVVAIAAAVGFWLMRGTGTGGRATSTTPASTPLSSASPLSTPPSSGTSASMPGSPTPSTLPATVPTATAPPATALPPVAAGPQLVWFDREGTELGRVGAPGDYGDVSLSPDGMRVAVSMREPGSEAADIWVFDVASGMSTRVTSDPADDIAPVWSPDGRRILFTSSRTGSYDIYERASSDTGGDAVLVEAAGDQIAYDRSSDGRYLVYQTDQPGDLGGGNLDLWARRLPGGRPFAFLRTVQAASRATLAPDGSRVAYTSLEGGSENVYVARFPSYDGRRRMSVGGGSWSRWSRDGSEIFYLDPDNRLMAAPVDAGSSDLGAGTPRALFQVRTSPNRGYAYDVSADGQRFLVSVVGDAVGDVSN